MALKKSLLINGEHPERTTPSKQRAKHPRAAAETERRDSRYIAREATVRTLWEHRDRGRNDLGAWRA